MKPANEWVTEWQYGVNPEQEKKASEELLVIFREFWDRASLDEKSKSTKQRYSAALHALGGYLVEDAGEGHRGNKSILEFINCHIDTEGGPLIHHDNEAWQNELDTVCRKLYKYVVNLC